jgi:hypothetical protein
MDIATGLGLVAGAIVLEKVEVSMLREAPPLPPDFKP